MKSNAKAIDGVVYSDVMFSSGTAFKAKFAELADNSFKAINDFIFELVEAYCENNSTNNCKKIEIKLMSCNKFFISFLMKIYYKDFFVYKSLNFDLNIMKPISYKIFLKRLNLKMCFLKKSVKGIDSNYKIDTETFYIFKNDLKFYCRKKGEEGFASFKIKIYEN